MTLGTKERVGHGAADQERVDLGHEMLDDLDLVGDLGAAEDRHQGTVGALGDLGKRLDLFLHEEAGGAFGRVKRHAVF